MNPLRDAALDIEGRGRQTARVTIGCGQSCGRAVSCFVEGLARLFVEGRIEVTLFVLCQRLS